MSDFNEWLRRKVREQAAVKTESASAAADCLGDPDPKSCDEVTRRSDEADADLAQDVPKKTREEMRRRYAPGTEPAILKVSEEAGTINDRVQKHLRDSQKLRDKATTIWKSSLWYEVPVRIGTYVAGVAVALAASVGGYRVLQKPLPTPGAAVTAAVLNAEQQRELESLKRGIYGNGDLRVTIDRPQSIADPVPVPRVELTPIPQSIARFPVEVILPERQVIVRPAERIISELPTPEAQQKAIAFIEQAQREGRGVTFTAGSQPASSSGSSTLPTGISFGTSFGSFRFSWR